MLYMNQLELKQKGQAISETTLTLLMLTPFLLLVPGIIYLLEIQNEAHEAARFSTWQSTLYRSEDAELYNQDMDLLRQMDDRVLNQVSFAGSVTRSGAQGYRDFQDEQSLVDTSAELVVRQSHQAVDADYESNIDTFMLPLQGPSQERTETELEGMLKVRQVSIPIRSNAALFNTELVNPYADTITRVQLPFDEVAQSNRLHISSQGGLVTDAWQPNSEQDFTNAVNGLTEPTQLSMAAWESLLNPMAGIFRELRILYRNGDASLNSVYGQQSRLLPSRLRRYNGE